MKTFYKNQIAYLELALLDINGDYASDLTVNYEVYKCSDDSLITSGIMTIVDNTYNFNYTFTVLGEYRIKYLTPVGYEKGIENIDIIDLVETGGLTTEQDAMLRRALGLGQENYRIFSPVYDSNGNMTTATIKIYPSASDCEADTNVTATYTVTSTYDSNHRMATYKVKKI